MDKYLLNLSIADLLYLSETTELYTKEQIVLDYVITHEVYSYSQIIKGLKKQGYKNVTIRDIDIIFHELGIVEQAHNKFYKPNKYKTLFSYETIEKARQRLVTKAPVSLNKFLALKAIQWLESKNGSYILDFEPLIEYFKSIKLNIDKAALFQAFNTGPWKYFAQTGWKPLKKYNSVQKFQQASGLTDCPIYDKLMVVLDLAIAENHTSLASFAESLSYLLGKKLKIKTIQGFFYRLDIARNKEGVYKPTAAVLNDLSEETIQKTQERLILKERYSCEKFIIDEATRLHTLKPNAPRNLDEISKSLSEWGYDCSIDKIKEIINKHNPTVLNPSAHESVLSKVISRIVNIDPDFLYNLDHAIVDIIAASETPLSVGEIFNRLESMEFHLYHNYQLEEQIQKIGFTKNTDGLYGHHDFIAHNIDYQKLSVQAKENLANKNRKYINLSKCVCEFAKKHQCKFITQITLGLAKQNIFVTDDFVINTLKNSGYSIIGKKLSHPLYVACLGIGAIQKYIDNGQFSLLGEWLKQVDFKTHAKNFTLSAVQLPGKVFYNTTFTIFNLTEFVIIYGNLLETGKLDHQRLNTAIRWFVALNPSTYQGFAALTSNQMAKSGLQLVARVLTRAFSGLIGLGLLAFTATVYRDELYNALQTIKKATGKTLGDGLASDIAQFTIDATSKVLYAIGTPLNWAYDMVTEIWQELFPLSNITKQDLRQQMPIVLQKTSWGDIAFDTITQDEVLNAQFREYLARLKPLNDLHSHEEQTFKHLKAAYIWQEEHQMSAAEYALQQMLGMIEGIRNLPTAIKNTEHELELVTEKLSSYVLEAHFKNYTDYTKDKTVQSLTAQIRKLEDALIRLKQQKETAIRNDLLNKLIGVVWEDYIKPGKTTIIGYKTNYELSYDAKTHNIICTTYDNRLEQQMLSKAFANPQEFIKNDIILLDTYYENSPMEVSLPGSPRYLQFVPQLQLSTTPLCPSVKQDQPINRAVSFDYFIEQLNVGDQKEALIKTLKTQHFASYTTDTRVVELYTSQPNTHSPIKLEAVCEYDEKAIALGKQIFSNKPFTEEEATALIQGLNTYENVYYVEKTKGLAYQFPEFTAVFTKNGNNIHMDKVPNLELIEWVKTGTALPFRFTANKQDDMKDLGIGLFGK